MAYAANTGTEHVVVKPQKIVDTAVGMLEQQLLIPNLFTKESIDQFRGAEDDTVSVKVEGILPFHDYEWRSGKDGSGRAAIQFDQYKERKIAVTFGGNVYNAVELTDEQAEMDMDRWGKLLTPQVKAVARGLGRRAVSTLTGQSYNVVIGDAEQNLRGALIEARRVLNRFNVPENDRYLLVGTDFESVLLDNEKLAAAANVGEAEAVSVLSEATIGRKFGFTIIVDQTIPADAAYAFSGSAFIFLNAAPSVPASVKQGATQSFEGVSMRWITDYSADYQTDRSVVNTYAGFREVKDVLVGWDEAKNSEVVSEGEHFVRGIKLVLDGASTYPAVDSELGKITGVTGPGRHLQKDLDGAAGVDPGPGTVAND